MISDPDTELFTKLIEHLQQQLASMSRRLDIIQLALVLQGVGLLTLAVGLYLWLPR